MDINSIKTGIVKALEPTSLKDAFVGTIGTLLLAGGTLVGLEGHVWEGLAAIVVGYIGYVVYEKI